MVKLAAGLGVDRVKGHHLWVHSRQMRQQSMRRDRDAIRRWNEVVDAAHQVSGTTPAPGRRQGAAGEHLPAGRG